MGTDAVQGSFCSACGTQMEPGQVVCGSCRQLAGAEPGVQAASWIIRVLAAPLDGILVILTLVIGYIIWWVIVLGRGQTPGKQLLGIWAIRDSGERVGWGLMFVRELLVKGILFPILYPFTLYILFFLNFLWPLWDKNSQALHDKLVGTIIVRGPRTL